LPDLIADCPRCGSRRTALTLHGETRVGEDFGWAIIFEVFVVCRHCNRSSIFVVRQEEYADRDHFRAKKLNDLDYLSATLRPA
jgi:hypothetical protein